MSSSAAIPAQPDAALVEKLVMANRILFYQGVVDGFGASACGMTSPWITFLLSRNRAPGLVRAENILCLDMRGDLAAFRAPLMSGAVHAKRNLQSPPQRDVHGAQPFTACD